MDDSGYIIMNSHEKRCQILRAFAIAKRHDPMLATYTQIFVMKRRAGEK